MKLRHLPIVFLVVAFAIAVMGQVSADYLADYNATPYNESTEVAIGDVSFTIPEGFGEYDDKNATADLPDLGSDKNYAFYICEDGGKIHIVVVHDFLGMSLDDIKVDGANRTTINGKEGWSYDKNDLHYFSYVEDNNAVFVGVTNQSRIGSIIS